MDLHVTLDLNFGFGQGFLKAWQDWRERAEQRPGRLHHVAVLEQAPTRAELKAQLDAAASPIFEPDLIEALLAHWWGLQPGFHRLQFEHQQVVLTLCLGERRKILRELFFQADQVHWDGQVEDLKPIAKLCKRGALLHWAHFPSVSNTPPAPEVQAQLSAVGFKLPEQAPFPLAPARYEPHWEPRRPPPLVSPVASPMDFAQNQTLPVLVIGAGLAGAACARALADRGWSVKVLDAAATPATVGSGLPAGIFAPHYSSDDGRLSQITRNGVRHTWQAARAHLRTGLDWLPCGVLEHRLHGRAGVPAQDGPSPASAEHGFSREADPSQKQALGLSPQAPVTWHPYAGWIKPTELTKALLKHPLIEFQGHCEVKALAQGTNAQWLALDQLGNTLAEAHWVIVAGGPFSRSLMPADIAPGMALDAVRGQLTWGESDNPSGWPPVPVNGHGSLIAQVPQTDRPGQAWFAGATFDRSPGQPDWSDLAQLNRPVPTTTADTQHNLQKLKALWPAAEAHRLDAPHAPPLQAWASIRCTSADRLPWVGPIDPEHQAGLWLCTAMGARGLSWALLCAELLACWACGEPLPLEASHARALLACQKTN